MWAVRHTAQGDEQAPLELMQLCGRGSGGAASSSAGGSGPSAAPSGRGLLAAVDPSDPSVLQLVAAMEQLGAILVGDCMSWAPLDSPCLPAAGLEMPRACCALPWQAVHFRTPSTARASLQEEQQAALHAELRAAAVAALQEHLLPGIEALSTATMAHPCHVPAAAPLKVRRAASTCATLQETANWTSQPCSISKPSCAAFCLTLARIGHTAGCRRLCEGWPASWLQTARLTRPRSSRTCGACGCPSWH
jgi:hypothetical protein